jgi:signal transduction histidine kinase
MPEQPNAVPSAPQPGSLNRLLLTHELAFLVLVVVAGGIGGIWAYFWQQTSAESFRLNYLANTAQEIRSDMFRQIKDVTIGRLRDDPAAEAQYEEILKRIKESFNGLRQHSGSRAEDYAIQHLQQAYGQLQFDMNEIFEDTYLLNRMVRSKLLDPKYEHDLVSEFEAAYTNLQGLIRRQVAVQGAEIETWTRFAPYAITIPIFVAVLLLLVSRASLQRGFVRPMASIMEGTRSLSAGDRHQDLDENGVEEVAVLARGINHMTAELARSRDALVEAEKQAALGALVPVVAHNIRNPLAAIRANAQLLEYGAAESEVAETRSAIIDTVDRLGRWVSALVSYLHPLKPVPRDHRASMLFDDTLDLLRPRLIDKEIEVIREAWAEDATVSVDADLMEQAFYGIISNAIDASPRGADLRFSIVSDDDAIRLSVVDQGEGIPFDPEPTALAPGPTTKRMGTGLGIPVAFKVAKAHGWDLEFDATPGKGTRVTFIAPKRNIGTDAVAE